LYRLFIDEVGHDNLNSANDPHEQHLCLLGAAMDMDTVHATLTEQMNAMKNRAFGTIDVVLHRREIIDKNPPPFDRLKDEGIREAFNAGLLAIIDETNYSAIAVIIDKKAHFEKYSRWHFHPYHYCLTAMIERYVMLLDERNARGDVMAEWRGIKPNRKLEAAYAHIYKNGTPSMGAQRFQNRLSSGQLKIRKKSANVAGLQLADLLASPASRYLICKLTGEEMKAPFGKEVVRILREKRFHRNWRGVVTGCGTKCLP